MFSYKAYTEMEKDGINVKVYAGFDAMKKSNITPIDPSSASITYNNTMHEKWTSLRQSPTPLLLGQPQLAPIMTLRHGNVWSLM